MDEWRCVTSGAANWMTTHALVTPVAIVTDSISHACGEQTIVKAMSEMATRSMHSYEIMTPSSAVTCDLICTIQWQSRPSVCAHTSSKW